MSMYQRDPRAGAFLGGDRVSGQDIRDQNGECLSFSMSQEITERCDSFCRSIYCKCGKKLPWSTRAGQNASRQHWRTLSLIKSIHCTKASIQEVTISNDGATILSLLHVEHPAGKIFVDLAQKQDKEVGDGTTSVVIIAAELLRRANELVKARLHPTTIINGYRLACKEAVKFMQEQLSVKVDSLGKEALISVARTAMASKIIGKCVKFLFFNFSLSSSLLDFWKLRCWTCIVMMTFLRLWPSMPCSQSRRSIREATSSTL